MSYEKLKEEIRQKRLGLDKSNQKNKKNIQEEENFDEYFIDENWQRLKKLVDRIEPRLYKFMFKGTVDASIDARHDLNEIRKLCIEIRKGILNKRQDNESDYS
jgi:hypothetical protein